MKKLILTLAIVSGLAAVSLHAGESAKTTKAKSECKGSCDKSKSACDKSKAMCPKAAAEAKKAACCKGEGKQASNNVKGAELLIQ
jgi:hypothetical protein